MAEVRGRTSVIQAEDVGATHCPTFPACIAWEKTLHSIKEQDKGAIIDKTLDMAARAKRRRAALRAAGSVKLGMMRHLFLIIDFSECMLLQDFKPTRQRCVLKLLEEFIQEFFDQNPISQMSILITRNKRAEKITELAGNPRKHIEALQKLRDTSCSGEPSLQNGLEAALQVLQNMPSHTSREVMVIFGSLTTCDPGDISVTLQSLQQKQVRVCAVGMSAEVHVLRRVCKGTKGEYGVPLDEQHFRSIVLDNVLPPKSQGSSESALVKMGFPGRGLAGTSEEDDNLPALCVCHMDQEEQRPLTTQGHRCPQCLARYCELPVECRLCGLTLVSAAHLARSYHHLFPLAAFVEKERAEIGELSHCYGCVKPWAEADKIVYECSTCQSVYCLECDLFLHDTLHTCPGCASHPTYVQKSANPL
nr:EOG090X05VA [Lepidurus arcticus]